MPTKFKYQAVDDNGRVKTGTINSHNTETVEEFLDRHQLKPISISALPSRRPFSFFGFLKTVDYEKLINFTGALSTMHKAGIPLLQALSIIKVGKAGGRFNQIIEQLRFSVKSGKMLSEAMLDHEDTFNRVYIAGIAAGEESGKLEYTLDEMSKVLEEEMELTRNIKSAVRYPIIVISVISAAFVVMMTYVIPRFVNFYASFDATLPLPTRIMIGVSNVFTQYWPILLGALMVLGVIFKKYLSTTRGRFNFDRALLKTPVIGPIITKGNVARFAMLFKILFASGIPVVRCLSVLSGTVRNSVIAREINHLEEMFRKGKDVDIKPENFDFLPDMSLYMLAIGLESGSMDRMLEEIGTHYAKEVNYTSRHLTSIIEPILTIILGIFVLLLALAIFLPMWNLIKVFQG